MSDPILVKYLVERDLGVLLQSVPFARFYDLYRNGGRLYLDTGTGRMFFTFNRDEVWQINLEAAAGCWIYADLDVRTCDPGLTFPFDYFQECMWDEYKVLRGEFEKSAKECLQDLLFRAAVESKNYSAVPF
jgi:hypothetical protein